MLNYDTRIDSINDKYQSQVDEILVRLTHRQSLHERNTKKSKILKQRPDQDLEPLLKFYRACTGHENSIRNFLESLPDVNFKGDYNISALTMAVTHNQIICLKSLLDRGANINTTNHFLETPLMEAGRIGNIEALHLLVARGASINMQNNNGYSALMLAVRNQQDSSVEFLVRQGANINLVNIWGDSAIMEAIKLGDINYLQYFMHLGADSSIINKNGFSLLMLASAYGHLDCLEYIMTHPQYYTIKTLDPYNAFTYAIENKHTECVNVIISYSNTEILRGQIFGFLRQVILDGDSDIILATLEIKQIFNTADKEYEIKALHDLYVNSLSSKGVHKEPYNHYDTKIAIHALELVDIIEASQCNIISYDCNIAGASDDMELVYNS